MPRSPEVPPEAVPIRTYADLDAETAAFFADHYELLILIGKPGLGKTEAMRKYLKLHPGIGHLITGKATPLASYKECYDYIHRLLIFNDAEVLWDPVRLARRIDELHRLFSRFTIEHGMCTSFDYEYLLFGTTPALLYLDPPYYHKGRVCYEKGFSPADHQRLAAILRSSIHHWVLSYDDCPEIRGLYRWARIRPVPVTYSIHHHARKHTELLITKD